MTDVSADGVGAQEDLPFEARVLRGLMKEHDISHKELAS
ncbi:hypothetical protein BAQU_0070 [Bifidobacterium aquikefiri]|uniref:Uncharacterized protein n=1 Tax=Bifidobacterium aquikefiri TaxID=1653207 RepID=A0A261GBG4_9BIFI|nr:hypothetical protein BAQU_0070 [Bifidobacterium aquikefiri]